MWQYIYIYTYIYTHYMNGTCVFQTAIILSPHEWQQGYCAIVDHFVIRMTKLEQAGRIALYVVLYYFIECNRDKY